MANVEIGKKELDFELWKTYLNSYCVGYCNQHIQNDLMGLTKDQLEIVLKAKKNNESKELEIMRRGNSQAISPYLNITNNQVNMLLNNISVKQFFYFMECFPHKFEFEDLLKKDSILTRCSTFKMRDLRYLKWVYLVLY